jgi:hypothetical protein
VEAGQQVPVVVGTAAVSQITRPDFFSTDDERNLDFLTEHSGQLFLDCLSLGSARGIAQNGFVDRSRYFSQGIDHEFLLV